MAILSRLPSGINSFERDDEWLKAQQEVEANRRRKEEESRQEGGKTLYEVLQSNKGDYILQSTPLILWCLEYSRTDILDCP